MVSFGILSLQNCRSLSKLEVKLALWLFMLHLQKILNSLAKSFEFSMIQSLNLRGKYLHCLRLTCPYFLNPFPKTFAGVFDFPFKNAEYCCFFDCLIILHTLFRQNLYCSLSTIDLYLSRVLIASIISPVSHFGCCWRLTLCCFKGRCLSAMPKTMMTKFQLRVHHLCHQTFNNNPGGSFYIIALKFLKYIYMYEMVKWDFLTGDSELIFLVAKQENEHLSLKWVHLLKLYCLEHYNFVII